MHGVPATMCQQGTAKVPAGITPTLRSDPEHRVVQTCWLPVLCPRSFRSTGVHLHSMPFGPRAPGNANWCSNFQGPDAILPSQLVSTSGTKVALQGLTVPCLKTTCSTALSAAGGFPQGMTAFFWAVHAGLAAQLQHGVSIEQGSAQEVLVVMRKGMISCAHLACILVTMYNMLLDGPQPQQQQQQGAGGGGAGTAAAASGGGGSDAEQQQQQQQQREGMLSCELSHDAKGVGMGALQDAIRAQKSGGQTTVQTLHRQQGLPTTADPRKPGKRVVVVTPPADARRLVQGLCPALDALLALRAFADPLPIVPFAPPPAPKQLTQTVKQQKWSAEMLSLKPFPAAQLLSRQGVLHAIKGLTYGAFQSAVAKRCEDNRAARVACAREAQESNHRDCGLTGLFWGLLGLVRKELEAGITATAKNHSIVAVIMRDYVVSVAHVGNMLAQMYDALLLQQQLQQGQGGRPAAAAAAAGRGGSGGVAAAAAAGGTPAQQPWQGYFGTAGGGAAPLQQQQQQQQQQRAQGHGMAAAAGGGGGGGGGVAAAVAAGGAPAWQEQQGHGPAAAPGGVSGPPPPSAFHPPPYAAAPPPRGAHPRVVGGGPPPPQYGDDGGAGGDRADG